MGVNFTPTPHVPKEGKTPNVKKFNGLLKPLWGKPWGKRRGSPQYGGPSQRNLREVEKFNSQALEKR